MERCAPSVECVEGHTNRKAAGAAGRLHRLHPFLRIAVGVSGCGTLCVPTNADAVWWPGVAFSTLDMKQPQFINRWPGTDEVANKVPTAVTYRAGNMANTSWGFGCPPPDRIARSMAVKDLFKLYLDPAVLEGVFRSGREYAPGTIDDVRMWFKHFLRELYEYIWEYLGNWFEDDWQTSTVEYIFSVPTTWNDPAVVEDFKGIVRAAGFGENKRHSVIIGLTEAEAAAVYTAKNVASQRAASGPGVDLMLTTKSATGGAGIREGHTLLVCDSGGGTTVRVCNHHDR